MKPAAVVSFFLLALVATWVACSASVPGIRSPADVLPIPGIGAADPATELEEGLLDLSVFGRERMPLPDQRARTEGVARLTRGLEQDLAGAAGSAAAEFDAARELLPPLADWADVLAARAYARQGDVREVRARLERVGNAPAAEWAWRAEHEALLVRGDTAGAIEAAVDAARRASTSPERAWAWSRAGALRGARRDAGGALDAYRSAMRESPGSSGGLAAARGAHDLPGLGPDDRLLVGRTLLAHGGIDRAIPQMEAYASAPGTPAADRAEVRLEAGRALFNARRYEPAERNLRVAAATHPEAAFLLGRTLYRQGQQDRGTQAFLAVSRDHPGSPAAANALFLLGDLAHDAGRVTAATEHYRQTVATGVHNVSAADAAVRLAGIFMMAGETETARQEMERYLAERPRDRVSAPAIYWLGRAQLALGQPEEARARFEEVFGIDAFSYYGMLAANRLGISLRAAPLPDPPPVDETTATAIEHAFFRVDVLKEVGLDAEANLELARLQEALAEDHAALYYVAEAMSRHGQPIQGALLGRRIHQARDVWDDRLLRIVYQFPYRELVVREANRRGLDPYKVAGLIRQESFFNATAVSPVGAVGLMQVMPNTATGLARRAGISSFQTSMLRDPDVNVRLGTLYLADQMARWDGRLSDVYSAYNAGPNRVVRWRTYPEHRDDEIYVERIPIAETRDYVKRLTLNGEIYRRLYAED